MTETDATKRPLEIPERFIPYLEKYRIYKLFKDMVRDLVLNLPKDHVKHMKVYLNRHHHRSEDVHRVLLLVSPELELDVKELAKQMVKELGFFVITRRCVMDRYEKHDDYVPGCVSPALMSEVTKLMTLQDPVPKAGWLMFDHPCTIREARNLQQDGVLPTVTLDIMKRPPLAPPAPNPFTPKRGFYQQDYEGLKYAYKATLMEVHIDPEDSLEQVSTKCFNAIHACSAGQQGPGQGHHVVGAPGTYRVLLLGPRGSGRRGQALALAKQFELVFLHFNDMLREAKEKKDEIGEKLRSFGPSTALKAQIVKNRLRQKDCVDHGWVMTGYPNCGSDFEHLDTMTTPPNRVIFLIVSTATCKSRCLDLGVDWCTGRAEPRVQPHSPEEVAQLDSELDFYFSEALAELRAAAGITAVDVSAEEQFDKVQVRIQAAVMAAPAYNIEFCPLQHKGA